jgi:hypothetical protein
MKNKKRCHFLDRCYLPAETTYVFLHEECHPGVIWIATDLCAIHKKILHGDSHRTAKKIEEGMQ